MKTYLPYRRQNGRKLGDLHCVAGIRQSVLVQKGTKDVSDCCETMDTKSSLLVPVIARFTAIAFAAIQMTTVAPAMAAWDGVSSATGSCPLGEEGIECRRQLLANDNLENYGQMSNNAKKVSRSPTTGVPVSEMGSKYVQDTLDLAGDIETFINLDLYDERRPTLVKTLKRKGQAWASEYARGGSARKSSARTFYIAVDSIEGHFASNGMAPIPSNKLAKLSSSIEQTRTLLEEGK